MGASDFNTLADHIITQVFADTTFGGFHKYASMPETDLNYFPSIVVKREYGGVAEAFCGGGFTEKGQLVFNVVLEPTYNIKVGSEYIYGEKVVSYYTEALTDILEGVSFATGYDIYRWTPIGSEAVLPIDTNMQLYGCVVSFEIEYD